MNEIVQPASFDVEAAGPREDAREAQSRAVRLPAGHPEVKAGRLGVLDRKSVV